MSSSNFTNYCIAVLFLLCTVFLLTEGELYCFKKIHSTDDAKRGPICRGMINKTTSSGGKRPFRSPKGCCRSGGRGYAEDTLERFGKKGLKYQCTLCTDVIPKTKSKTTTTPIPTTTHVGWSEWGEWGECSTTCSIGVQERQRLCYTGCGNGKAVDKRTCIIRNDCPVDGGWGPWNDWTECTATCGEGNMTRKRRCNDPKPRHGGLDCQGDAVESSPCERSPCPVHGHWSEWSEATCTATCGSGDLVRKRECNNPAPMYNGSDCQGKDSTRTKCEKLPKCPIDGQWSLWGKWSSCTATCGNGTTIRNRQCVAPKPRNGGAPCQGEDVQHGTCYHYTPCSVDGGWTKWSEWTQCIATPCSGETGYTTRRRTCSNPLPQYNGAICIGDTSESKQCTNNFNCPVNGGWCDWSEYSECREFNSSIFKTKTRQCGCPVPEHGGELCTGMDFESLDCNSGGETARRCADRISIDDEDNLESSGYFDDEDC